MAEKKYSLVVTQELSGLRLDQALAEWLPQATGTALSKAKVRTLIVAGVVYLNGSRCRIASKELRFKARVEVFFNPQSLEAGDEAKSGDREFQLSEDSVIFEDEWLIAINKPFGLPSQPTLDRSRANLYEMLKKYLGDRERKSEAYVGLHHRLDRDTSGVILFTKKKEANFGVSEIFKKHLAQKTYHAVVKTGSAPPPEQWRVENYLAKEKGTGKKSKMHSVRSGGDVAITDFRILSRSGDYALIEAKPKTGRMHQIRVHLSEKGMPILGDATYGDRTTAPRLMLHAATLMFPHPITEISMTVSAPIPQDLSECLKLHRLR